MTVYRKTDSTLGLKEMVSYMAADTPSTSTCWVEDATHAFDATIWQVTQQQQLHLHHQQTDQAVSQVEYPRWYEFTQWFYPIQGSHIYLRVLSTATATKSWQRWTHTNRRTKAPAKTFHQWLVWYCSWFSKRMNVFPANMTGPVYMNILDSHYQNCWRMCHTPWESSSFHYGWGKKIKTLFFLHVGPFY